MKEIIIDIDEDGTPTIEGIGFQGPECKQFTDKIEKALGVVQSVKEKPEYKRSRPLVRKVGG